MDLLTSKSNTARQDVIELCSLEELEDGAARGFDLYGEGRDTFFIVRRGKSLNAYRNACPHQGASLPWRKNAYLDAKRTHIVCSAYGAQFDIDSGACVLGPALGQSLQRVDVSVTKNGKVRAEFSASSNSTRSHEV